MALDAMNDYTFKHSEQVDDLYTQLTSAQIKQKFDSRGIEIRTFINELVNLLNTDGASNLGIKSIQDLDGNTIQSIIQSIRDKLKSKADGTSGADYINATSIEGLTGETVQTIIEALKKYIDDYNTNHKEATSTDHDNRYYTESELDAGQLDNRYYTETEIGDFLKTLKGIGWNGETIKGIVEALEMHKNSDDHDTRYATREELQSVLEGNSGADNVKSTPLASTAGDTVQANLKFLHKQIASTALGKIPDGSVDETKLDKSLIGKIDKPLQNIGIMKESQVEGTTIVAKTNKLNEQLADIVQQRKTYKELKILKESNNLVAGTQYVLTDYATKYRQPTTNAIKEMEVEELVLTANSKNTFEPIVSSLLFPQDIIHYNFDDNMCEDGLTPRKGFIARRKDTKSNIDCPQDWRSMLWARWTPDENQYYYDDNLVNYEVWTSGGAKEGKLYKADNSLYIAMNSSTPSSNTDSNVFRKYYDLNYAFLINEKTKIANKIELKRGILQEKITFQNFESNYNIFIGDTKKLQNNIFSKNCHSNFFRSSCYDNTFGSTCYGNTFGSYCYTNTFGSYCYTNTFGSYCYTNTFGSSCYKNTFGNDCSSNTFGNYCYTNTFGSTCHGNTFGSSCSSNIFGSNCYKNTFGSSCSSNTFGNSCFGNTFGNYFQQNYVKRLYNKDVTIIGTLYNIEGTINIEKNKNNNFVYWYLDNSNTPVYTTIP